MKVKLESKDGQCFFVPREATEISSLLNDAFSADDSDDGDEDDDDDCDDEEKVLESGVLMVPGNVLQVVVDFLCHYAEEPMNEITEPLEGGTLEECLTQDWYADFCRQMPEGVTTRAVAKAADYLGIDVLLQLMTLVVTFEIIGMTPYQIRQHLDLPEVSEAEDAQIAERYANLFRE